jgi:hypothetical protein
VRRDGGVDGEVKREADGGGGGNGGGEGGREGGKGMGLAHARAADRIGSHCIAAGSVGVGRGEPGEPGDHHNRTAPNRAVSRRAAPRSP